MPVRTLSPSQRATLSRPLPGTAAYILRALTATGVTVARARVVVTQDTGDPEHSGFGYFTISLSNLPASAVTFRLTNEFVHSSFPQNTVMEFGVASVSYTSW